MCRFSFCWHIFSLYDYRSRITNMKDLRSSEVQDLYVKTISFFQRHGNELDQIRQLLDIRLSQLALAYTSENRLPVEAVSIKTRVKTFPSFLKKLETLNKTDFEYPHDMVHDLIGARVICWFLDDCKGIANCIRSSNFLTIDKNSVFDYIESPKPSGYRGIHIHAHVAYENMTTAGCKVKLNPQKLLCEIQVRTKLMDAWADLTHEFHYKAKNLGVEDKQLEKVLEAQSKRFFSEDESFIAIRNLYQKMMASK
jgi:putative GTP pyrophosphokinase